MAYHIDHTEFLTVICNMRQNGLFLLFSCFLIGVSSLTAQYDINISIDNYDNDTILIGYYLGNKQLVRDTLYAEEAGKFQLSGKDTLNNGVYLLLTYPDKEYVQFHINEGEKDFDLNFDYNDKSRVTFKGSPDNINFQSYLNLISENRARAQELRDSIAGLEEKGKDVASFRKELTAIDNKIIDRQAEIIKESPESLTAIILKASQDISVPDFENDKDPAASRFRYYKQHYFDNIDMENPLMIYSGTLHPKVDTYMKKLTANHPDSIIQSIDTLLNMVKPAEDTYRYFLSTFLNEYAKSKVIGFDAVFVHLVDNYYRDGGAPWVKAESLAKIVDNADKLKPVLLGNTGADIKVFRENGTPISISDIDYEYLVLLFWAPDCGHCTKMMPKFVEFNNTWKEKGVKLFAICSKHMDKTKTCWEKLEEKDMLGFINAADEKHRSRFKLKYNVSTTPKVFVLDKDRKILMKNIGSDQLEDVMIQILKQEGREDLIPEGLPRIKEETGIEK